MLCAKRGWQIVGAPVKLVPAWHRYILCISMSHMNYILRKLTQHTATRYMWENRSSLGQIPYVSTAICSRYRFRSWHLQGFPRCPQISAPMLSGWCFLNRPIWNICASQIGKLPQISGWKENNRFELPPPSCVLVFPQICFPRFEATPTTPTSMYFRMILGQKPCRPCGHTAMIFIFLHLLGMWHIASSCIVPVHLPGILLGKWQYHCRYKPKLYCWVLLEEWFASFFLSDINSIIRLHHSADRFVRSTYENMKKTQVSYNIPVLLLLLLLLLFLLLLLLLLLVLVTVVAVQPLAPRFLAPFVSTRRSQGPKIRPAVAAKLCKCGHQHWMDVQNVWKNVMELFISKQPTWTGASKLFETTTVCPSAWRMRIPCPSPKTVHDRFLVGRWFSNGGMP